jgi:hypothetical protein
VALPRNANDPEREYFIIQNIDDLLLFCRVRWLMPPDVPQPVRLIVLMPLDVPTLTTSRLPREPGKQRWNSVNLLVQFNIRMEQQLPS